MVAKIGVDIPKLIIHHAYLAGEYKQRKHKKGLKKDLTNPRKRATIRTSINYRCVPGKQEPAFAGLADLQNPPHKWHGFRSITHNPGAGGQIRPLLLFPDDQK